MLNIKMMYQEQDIEQETYQAMIDQWSETRFTTK